MSDPRPLRHGLDAVMRSLKAGDTATVKGVFGGWAEAVGELIAANVQPLKLDGDVLTVQVTQTPWATQVRFLEADLITKLHDATGVTIARIDVRVAGVGARRNRR